MAVLAYILGMSSTSRFTDEDLRRVEQAVRRHPLPPFVLGFDVEYGDDHDGDPALWVLFKLKPGDFPFTPGISVRQQIDEIQPKIDEMNRLASEVRSDLVDILSDRIVYTRFVSDQPRMGG